MPYRIALLIVSLAGLAHATADAPEFEKCTAAGTGVHDIIECLSTARDEWDRRASNLLTDTVEKADEGQRRRIYTQVKKQREQRANKCGVPSPVTVLAAECQRAMAEEQLVELERLSTALTK